MKQHLTHWALLPILVLTALLLATGVWANDATVTVTTERGEAYGTVTYDSIRCGTPTTFTVTPKDNGTYKYHLAHVIDGSGALIVDPTRSSYQEGNTFQFTFFASGTYRMRFSCMEMTVQPYKFFSIDIVISIQDPSHPTIEVIADQVAALCKSECTTDFEKALWLHDWVIDHCKYDHSLTYCHPEGVLARGTGTCESYHGAYAMLLSRVGLESKRVTGNGHAWTAVKIDGKWCQVDTTWDDSTYSVQGYDNAHLYFGLNDALTTKVHPDHQVDPTAICDTLDNNYFIHTGKIREISGVFDSAIQQNLAAGNLAFTLPVPDSARLLGSTDQSLYYTLAAYDLQRLSWTAGGSSYTLEVSYQPSASTLGLGSLVFRGTRVDSTTPSQPTTPPEPSPSQPSTPPEPTPSAPDDSGPLNHTQHIAYVKGFPDGTVRPADYVTRAQTATMLYRLLTAQRRDEIFTSVNSFTDVSAGNWFNKAVSSMAQGGYINGYPGGYFDPDRNITRAEFVTMVARFGTTENASASFTDVGEHWAYRYIAAASEKGWISGYPGGSFRPDQNITRAEAMTILNRVLGRGINQESRLCAVPSWKDNDPGQWYYYEVLEATNGHLHTGSRPSESWSALVEQTDYDIRKYENP